jgi:hypothetical protein
MPEPRTAPGGAEGLDEYLVSRVVSMPELASAERAGAVGWSG